MSHVAYMNESCPTCKWVMSHIWMSHVTHMNESCHTYEWVMSHIWMSHVTHMNESCPVYHWAMLHTWVSRVPRTKWAMWHVGTQVLAVCSYVSHNSCTCHITHSYVGHDSFIYATWHLYIIMARTCHVTHSLTCRRLPYELRDYVTEGT